MAHKPILSALLFNIYDFSNNFAIILFISFFIAILAQLTTSYIILICFIVQGWKRCSDFKPTVKNQKYDPTTKINVTSVSFKSTLTNGYEADVWLKSCKSR